MNEDGAVDAANPRLSEADVAALAEFGTRVRLVGGDPLFQAGLRRGGFFVVLSGAVEVLDRSGPSPRRVALHEAGQFTGEIDILTRRASGPRGWRPACTVRRKDCARCSSIASRQADRRAPPRVGLQRYSML